MYSANVQDINDLGVKRANGRWAGVGLVAKLQNRGQQCDEAWVSSVYT
jgi:hypothetical protein